MHHGSFTILRTESNFLLFEEAKDSLVLVRVQMLYASIRWTK